MGLDTVELIMEIEDEFRVAVPDAVAETLVTPGLVTDWLMSRLDVGPTRAAEVCPSQRAFYRLRDALHQTFGAKRRKVRPDAMLASVLPSGIVRTQWARFAIEQDLERPPYQLFKFHFELPNVTVRNLVEQKLKRGRWKYFRQNGRISRVEVLRAVITIISDHAGIPVEEITEDSHFWRDLHLD